MGLFVLRHRTQLVLRLPRAWKLHYSLLAVNSKVTGFGLGLSQVQESLPFGIKVERFFPCFFPQINDMHELIIIQQIFQENCPPVVPLYKLQTVCSVINMLLLFPLRWKTVVDNDSLLIWFKSLILYLKLITVVTPSSLIRSLTWRPWSSSYLWNLGSQSVCGQHGSGLLSAIR